MKPFRVLLKFSFLFFLSCSDRPTEGQTTGYTEPVDYFERFSDYKGFSLSESKKIHRNFVYDELTYVEGGGEHGRYIFLNSSEFFFSSSIRSDTKTRKLPINLRDDVANYFVLGDSVTLDQYINSAPVDGAIIIHEGKVVYESYPRMFWNDRHLWFSVSKVLAGTAIALLEDQGRLDTSSPVSKYLHELNGSHWETISLRNVLDMATGMDVKTDFDSLSNFWIFQKKFGGFSYHINPESNAPMSYLSSIEKIKEPGESFEYSDICTQILAWIVERVTNQKFTEFIEEEIWIKAGTEFDAHMITTMNGDSFAAAGMNSTLRDLARFGLLFTPSGRNEEYSVISENYLNQIKTEHNKKLKTKPWWSQEEKFNAYQWDDIFEDGDFYKHGHNGQGLYISTEKDLVIAYFGTRTTENQEHWLPVFARQLALSDLWGN